MVQSPALWWFTETGAYEDALLELGDILAGDGFLPVAGAVFVAEHSMTAKVATGRPRKGELAEGKAFGEQLKAKLAKDDLSRPEIPGNRPYKERKPSGGDPMYPATKENCIGCGICAKGCRCRSSPARIFVPS